MTSNVGTQGGAATGGETSGHRDEVGLGMEQGVDVGTLYFVGDGTSDEGETAPVIHTARRVIPGKPKVVRIEPQTASPSGLSSLLLKRDSRGRFIRSEGVSGTETGLDQEQELARQNSPIQVFSATMTEDSRGEDNSATRGMESLIVDQGSSVGYGSARFGSVRSRL